MPEPLDPITRDFYEERRRKWRRSAFWRGFLVAAVLAALLAAWFGSGAIDTARAHVARFEVAGIITDDPERDRLLEELADSNHVRALIVRVNSPGGTTAGSEALFASLRRVAGKKPVVAQLGEVAASGGYVAAIAADHIVGRGNTLTGSIGVIMEYPDLTGVMARLGIELETVRSSELKAEPSPFRPTNPAARARDEALVAESYRWFRDLVGERRGIDGARLDAVANGGVFTGRLALENGLIDEIGGEPEALAWLESREAGLARLPVREWEVEREGRLGERILGQITPTGGILGEISRWTGPKLYSIGP
jgi:protease-4